MGTDHAFAELGLAPGATEREVKIAWRRLVSRWHPDRNESADAVARMQRINQAFEALQRSGLLDRTPAGEPGSEPTAESATEAQAPDAPGPSRPPIHRKLKLTLEEAAAGCVKVLHGRVTAVCATCAGAGHQVLGGHCERCGGSGALSKRSFFGWLGTAVECEACLGGGIARQVCGACEGSGKAPAHKYRISVRIPPGVRSGDLLHVDSRRSRSERPPADLEIRIELAAHAFFRLDDAAAVHCEVPVDGFAWIGERTVTVPTLAGPQPLPLRRDTLAYRLPGEGFPLARKGPRGDLWITVQPVFPAPLSGDQQILLDQLMATGSRADGQPVDERLREWNRGLKAWARNLPPRPG